MCVVFISFCHANSFWQYLNSTLHSCIFSTVQPVERIWSVPAISQFVWIFTSLLYQLLRVLLLYQCHPNQINDYSYARLWSPNRQQYINMKIIIKVGLWWQWWVTTTNHCLTITIVAHLLKKKKTMKKKSGMYKYELTKKSYVIRSKNYR